MGKSSPHSAQSPAATTGRYPIRTVCSLTGVNPVTLRAWERRYNLITPQRTAKGHRLYTQMDIDRIHRVLALLDQGISIGQAGKLLEQESSANIQLQESEYPDIWQHYRERMEASIRRFDETTLDAIYNDALSLYPVDVVNSRLTTPILRNFGDRWKEEPVTIAEEHFFSVYLRNKLGSRIHHLNQRNSGPLLLLCCLPGEFHEIGMLFFALAAVDRWYRVLLLGANMPLDQIPEVIEQQPCEAIILSGSARPARGLFQDALPQLVRNTSIPVFVGGGVAERNRETIENAGAICAGKDIKPALGIIDKTLSAAA